MLSVTRGFGLRVVMLAGALALFNVLALSVGGLKPAHAALDGFVETCADKPQPCWNGIVPGVTTIDETRRIMAYAGSGVTLFNDLTEEYMLYFILTPPSPICVAQFLLDREVIARVQLQVCREADMTIGDLTGTFGLPRQVVMIPPQNLVYGEIAVNTEGWLMPLLPYSQISFINLLRPSSVRQRFFDWHGFVPAWRYCQLEPDYPSCR
jgi:hypothetical protein